MPIIMSSAAIAKSRTLTEKNEMHIIAPKKAAAANTAPVTQRFLFGFLMPSALLFEPCRPPFTVLYIIFAKEKSVTVRKWFASVKAICAFSDGFFRFAKKVLVHLRKM